MLPSYSEFAATSSLAPAQFSRTMHLSAPRADLNKQGCHTPYNNDCSTITSEDDSSEHGSSIPPSPSNLRTGPLMTLSYPPQSTIHTPLWGRCELIQTPVITPVDTLTPQNAFPLFLGQVRFETTAAELRWILRRVSGVLALKVELRGTGCFIVFLKSSADADSIRRLHKRLLFDHSGVWFARTETEVEALFDYVNNTLPYISRRCHLPRDSMVVEEVKMFHRGNDESMLSSPPAEASQPSQPVSPYFASMSSRGASFMAVSPPSPCASSSDAPPPYTF